MAGKRPEIFVSGAKDVQEITPVASQIKIDGFGNFFTAVKIAQLALKHRQNERQRQRIITFCGHPIAEDVQKCEELGKILKRNKVSIDIINFANPANAPKLEALVNAANLDDNCHFLNVPPESDNIEGILFTSSILIDGVGGDGLDGVGGMQDAQLVGGPANNNFGGIGEDMDPELARAL